MKIAEVLWSFKVARPFRRPGQRRQPGSTALRAMTKGYVTVLAVAARTSECGDYYGQLRGSARADRPRRQLPSLGRPAEHVMVEAYSSYPRGAFIGITDKQPVRLGFGGI